MKKILALLLSFTLAFSFVSCGECEHVDEDGDSFCDKCDEELDGEQTVCEHDDADNDGFCDACENALIELTEEEWKTAFGFDNAELAIKEEAFYNGTSMGTTESNYFAVDSNVYTDIGISYCELDDLSIYFAFKDSYSSFLFNTKTGEYNCADITVDGTAYKNVTVAFGSDKKLASVKFEASNYYYDFVITTSFSGQGTTTIPVRAPFVPKEGDDYCKYYAERNVEGHKLAYVTMTVKGYGDVKLLLDATTAPVTVANFLNLVNKGFYDGLTFHRVINDFMIQGGDPKGDGTGGHTDKDGNKLEIKGEFSSNGHENDILHLRGVISMARGSSKDSASSQFFICNADASWLDGEYAAFGYVIDGMSVIDHVTYDTYVYDGDGNGTIYDTTKRAVIEKIVIDELVGITLDEIIAGENELPLDKAD